MAYWIGSNLYGPRYYYEGFYSLTLVSAAGMFWLAESVFKQGLARRWMQGATIFVGVLLLLYNLLIYLPTRLHEMTGLYGISRAMLAPFETQQAKQLAPVLVIVHYNKVWTEYGGLLELENADLTSPFIFALSRSPSADSLLVHDYPTRHVVHFYTDQPNRFYQSPK
jgi:hypothetical protein